jgi:hypothetical protein
MVDVWQLDLASKTRQRLTLSDVQKQRLEISADSTLLAYEQVRDEAHIAKLDPADPKPSITMLTSDSLSDVLPDVSRSGKTAVFQRSTFIDDLGTTRATVQLSRDDFRSASERLATGTVPLISADGRWVAYLVTDGGRRELWVMGVRDRQSRLVTDSFVGFSYEPFPLAITSPAAAWSPTTSHLYFMARAPGAGVEIWAADPAVDGPIRPTQVTSIGLGTASVSDLRVSQDGSRISYLLIAEGRPRTELHVVVLARKEDSVHFAEKSLFQLNCLGWTGADDALIVLRSDEQITIADVLVVKAGSAREVGRVREPVRSSWVLDPRRPILYFTRARERVNSLHSFALENGQERELWRGALHAPEMGGLRIMESGEILFSLQSQNHDILASRFGR